PQYGGTLRVETLAALRAVDPTADDPDRDTASLGRRVRPLVFETLVQVDPQGGLRPLLASAWESDARSTRWRFRLRTGGGLPDGSALEPWQVAASLRAAGEGWTIAIDDDAVVVQLASPRTDLPWELADMRYGVAVRRNAGEVIGSGPFRIDRVEPTRL